MDENLKNEAHRVLSQLTENERKELWEELVQGGIIPVSLASATLEQ